MCRFSGSRRRSSNYSEMTPKHPKTLKQTKRARPANISQKQPPAHQIALIAPKRPETLKNAETTPKHTQTLPNTHNSIPNPPLNSPNNSLVPQVEADDAPVDAGREDDAGPHAAAGNGSPEDPELLLDHPAVPVDDQHVPVDEPDHDLANLALFFLAQATNLRTQRNQPLDGPRVLSARKPRQTARTARDHLRPVLQLRHPAHVALGPTVPNRPNLALRSILNDVEMLHKTSRTTRHQLLHPVAQLGDFHASHHPAMALSHLEYTLRAQTDHTHLRVRTTRERKRPVPAQRQRRRTARVHALHHVERPPALRPERTDVPVRPRTDYLLPVRSQADRVARRPRNRNSQKFRSRHARPDRDEGAAGAHVHSTSI